MDDAMVEYCKEGSSERHLRDITGIVKVMGDRIDRAYITRWAEELALVDIWNRVLEGLGEP